MVVMKKTEDKIIRVLIVEGSALMRQCLSDIINSDPKCEVVATARDGEEALRAVAALHPDVITLDIELPGMDGMTALKYIMSEWPTPVVIITAYTEYGGENTIKCLQYGAVDFVEKPCDITSPDSSDLRNTILAKIKAASLADVGVLKPILIKPTELPQEVLAGWADKLVVIAASTGGPRALSLLLSQLEPDIQAGVIVVQHMPKGFTEMFAKRLNRESRIRIREACHGDCVRNGEVLVAPGGSHLHVKENLKKGRIVRLHDGRSVHGVCPAADVTMKSIASSYVENCCGVVLTGMGDDGTEGLRAIKNAGGYTLAECESTSVIYGMPKAASDAGVVDRILPLNEIADEIMRWIKSSHQ